MLSRRLLQIAAVSLLFSRCVAAEGTTWAVLIGVDNYMRSGVSKLNYAGADAKLLAKTLVDKLKVQEKNIFLYTTDAADENNLPSLTNVVYRLDWLRQNAGPDDTIIFYFAGHGINKDKETYLLTQEADPRASATLKITSINGATVYENLSQSKARNSLVLLDACRNDPTGGRGDVSNPLDDEFSRSLVYKGKDSGSNPSTALSQPSGTPARNLATLFACSIGERSWESQEKKHGYFTYYLVEALSKSAQADGKVTLQTVNNYICKEVKEATFRHETHPQTPMLRYEGPGTDSWLLTSYNAAPVVLGSVTPDQASIEKRVQAERMKAESEKAKAEAAEAAKKLAEEKARAAEEKLTNAEARRYELEIQNKALEKRAALLELEKQAGLTQNTAAQDQMKAELEKARQELARVAAALADSEAKVEASRKKKEEAEKLAAQLEAAGKTKDAEKARTEAAENLAAMQAERAKSEATRRQQVEAENQELQKRMAMLEVKANEGLKGNEAAARLQKELEQARDEVRLARQMTQASEARAESARMAVSEAETRQQQAERQAQAALAKVNTSATDPESQKEIGRLLAETERYKQLLIEATRQRVAAEANAKQTQSELASSEVDYRKKHNVDFKKPKGMLKWGQLLQIEEAQELPDPTPGPTPK
ncbi:MAG: caspase family protein [Vulcanimicrobiota bacterium]